MYPRLQFDILAGGPSKASSHARHDLCMLVKEVWQNIEHAFMNHYGYEPQAMPKMSGEAGKPFSNVRSSLDVRTDNFLAMVRSARLESQAQKITAMSHKMLQMGPLHVSPSSAALDDFDGTILECWF